MKIIITGAAGFIGSRLAEVLAEAGGDILGIDNLSPYYDPRLKLMRLERCGFNPDDAPRKRVSCKVMRDSRIVNYDTIVDGSIITSHTYPNLRFLKLDLADDRLEDFIGKENPDVIVHLAAQPGVRYSIRNARECVESNVLMFMRILDICKDFGVHRLLYASSSSVYGSQHPHPFMETDRADRPMSVYAVTKRTNEMLAQVYTDMYGFKAVGMRFFSVYGEWGRPDMAPMLFARAILDGNTIDLFNGGRLSRDFTYIDDVAECIRRVIFYGGGMSTSAEGHEILNIGRGDPTQLTDFVHLMERTLGKKAKVRLLPMQPGEVMATLCDASKVKMQYGYSPDTDLREGLLRFAKWVVEYHSVMKTLESCDITEHDLELVSEAAI